MKYENQEVDLYESGNAPRVKNVKVGDIIRARAENYYGNELMIDNPGILNWTVQKVYPYMVYATCDGMHKCFSYGDLVVLGLEAKFTENYSN